ncbi:MULTISPECIES: hypothetical protein [Pseudomonas]|uniref:Lipoprotein n=1 Tax=Pseudomonas entomophila TaxID=312306 RepID=A0A3S8UE13_9PSED|nr:MULTISPECIES: hypothetical protein [Pseudomonas]AZL66548.1 hypothetical protein EJA05_01800 [Pseudomonas oryziphila]MDZ4019549.1 hypothetical protein [Pseudomonas sichuanensis]UVL89684.1 hypothetical protein LOY51_01880 [Pseudomonas sichuanensis]
MKRNYVALLLLFLLAACAPLVEKPPAPVSPPIGVEQAPPTLSAAQSLRLRGPAAAAQLKGWYDQTADNCGSATRPSFLCSGVMLRGTLSRQSYFPWDPSPGSVASGGVSFAWIRTDTNFRDLPMNYNNGFIFYPVLDTPAGKNSDIQIMCSFPFDGWTDIRNQQGCGTTTQYPTQSRPCSDQGINTGQQWITHFNAAADKYKAQCGWNVREGQPNTADRFKQSTVGRSLITTSHWYGNNELRLATWAAGTGAQLPIQSFFYVAGTAGLASAQDDQRRYYQAYNQVVPVIQLTFASNKNAKASFIYNESDQVVGGEEGPDPIALIDFENVPLQENVKEFSVPSGKFVAERPAGVITVHNRVPPLYNISGHHLFLKSEYYGGAIFTPNSPVGGVSFDYWHGAGTTNNAGFVRYVGGGIYNLSIEPGTLVGRVNFMAPPGKKIESISILLVPPSSAIDNIKLYE